jgi:hypothetical protein
MAKKVLAARNYRLLREFDAGASRALVSEEVSEQLWFWIHGQ